MNESRVEAALWLQHSIQSALEEAGRGAPFSNFGFDLDEGPMTGVVWELRHDRELRTIYEFADSYFLGKAHGDPDHGARRGDRPRKTWRSTSAAFLTSMEAISVAKVGRIDCHAFTGKELTGCRPGSRTSDGSTATVGAAVLPAKGGRHRPYETSQHKGPRW